MSLESDIRTYLLGRPGISGIIGTRMYFQKLPKNPTLPAITLRQLSAPRSYTHDGDSNFTRSRIQFTCWDLTYDGIKTLASAMLAELSGFRGAVGSTEVYSSFIDIQPDDLEPDTKFYYLPLDAMIRHNG